MLALIGEQPAAAADGFGALALPDAEGDPARADELMLPDAALRPLLAADTPLGVLDPGWAARFPRASWSAIGVLDGFAVVVDEDPAGPEHDLDDEERWWDGLPEPPRRLLAVRDLDLVDDDGLARRAGPARRRPRHPGGSHRSRRLHRLVAGPARPARRAPAGRLPAALGG